MVLVGTPGFGFRKLIDLANEETLCSLLDPKTFALISALDPAILSGDRLRHFVRESRSSRSYLTNPDSRGVLLDLLPREKARELCRRLELQDTGDPYLTLKSAELRAGNATEESLLSFFGAMGEAVPRPSTITAVDTAKAQYPLFPHQRSAAQRVISSLNRSPRRVLLHMPTGGGKTRTAMNVVAEFLRSNEPSVVVWLAYSRELLDQAANEFENAWGRLGNRDLPIYRFWGNASCDPLEAQDAFIVAGLGKLFAWSKAVSNRLPRLADRVCLTVMDEAHQSIANTYSGMLDLLAAKRSDGRLLGLSATPGRTWSDISADARLADFFGRQKVTLEIDGYDNPVKYLMDEGYLAKPTFSTLNREAGIKLADEDLAALASELDVPESVMKCLAEDEHRTLQIVRKVEELLTRHIRIIVFATTVEHAELVSAILRARGHQAEAVTGSTPQYERQSILQRYTANTSTPFVICNFGVLTTGFDAPRTSAALIARPTRSLVLFSQMVGRAIRGTRAGGNKEAEIITVVDPELPGFGSVSDAFVNWEDVWQQK